MRRVYQTDLSDAEWSYLEPHLPTPKAPGRPRTTQGTSLARDPRRHLLHRVRSGCAWRLLPHDFPPWKTVHHYLRTWRIDGTWERISVVTTEAKLEGQGQKATSVGRHRRLRAQSQGA